MFENVVPLPWNDSARWLDVLYFFSFFLFYESVCVRPPAAYRLLYLVVIAEMLVSFDLISCLRCDFKRVFARRRNKIGSLCLWLYCTICFPPPVFTFFTFWCRDECVNLLLIDKPFYRQWKQTFWQWQKRYWVCGCEIFHANRLFRGQTLFSVFPACSKVLWG